MNNFNLDGVLLPSSIKFRITDCISYAVEFSASNSKQFEIECKKSFLKNNKNKTIVEIQILDTDSVWRNDYTIKRKHPLLINIKKIDLNYYYYRLLRSYQFVIAVSCVAHKLTAEKLKLRII